MKIEYLRNVGQFQKVYFFLIEIPEREQREDETEEIFELVMVVSFPKYR